MSDPDRDDLDQLRAALLAAIERRDPAAVELLARYRRAIGVLAVVVGAETLTRHAAVLAKVEAERARQDLDEDAAVFWWE